MTSPSPYHLELCVRTTLALPSAAACDLRLVEQSPGRAVCRLVVTEGVCAGTGALSGGDLYGLLDSIAYLALLTLLPDDEPKPLALATVTKSIISMQQRLRHRGSG